MQPFNFRGMSPLETNLQNNLIDDLERRTEALRGYL